MKAGAEQRNILSDPEQIKARIDQAKVIFAAFLRRKLLNTKNLDTTLNLNLSLDAAIATLNLAGLEPETAKEAAINIFLSTKCYDFQNNMFVVKNPEDLIETYGPEGAERTVLKFLSYSPKKTFTPKEIELAITGSQVLVKKVLKKLIGQGKITKTASKNQTYYQIK
jgi:hypothetical protein